MLIHEQQFSSFCFLHQKQFFSCLKSMTPPAPPLHPQQKTTCFDMYVVCYFPLPYLMTSPVTSHTTTTPNKNVVMIKNNAPPLQKAIHLEIIFEDTWIITIISWEITQKSDVLLLVVSVSKHPPPNLLHFNFIDNPPEHIHSKVQRSISVIWSVRYKF